MNKSSFTHMCVLSCTQLLVTQWIIVRQAPLSMGFSRQEYWSGLPFPPPGNLPNPGIESSSPAPQADSLLIELQQFSVTMLNDIVWYTCNLPEELILSVLTTKTVIAMFLWIC